MPVLCGAFAACASGVVLLLGGAFLLSTSPLEINEWGYATRSHEAPLRSSFGLYCAGVIWIGCVLIHVSRLSVAGRLTAAYWAAAEEKHGHVAPPTCLGPWLHVGSAALGGALWPLANPLLGAAQLLASVRGAEPPAAGCLGLSGSVESGYVAVAAYGCSFAEGGAFGAAVTRRFVPQLLGLQARPILGKWDHIRKAASA